MNSGHKRERGTILFILKGKELLKRKANDEAVRSLVDLTASAPSHELSGEHQRKSPHSSQTSTPERLITEDATRSLCTLPQRKLDCPANKRTSPRQRQLDFSASKRRSPRTPPPPQRHLDCTRNERRNPSTPLKGSWTVPGRKGVAPVPLLGGSWTVSGTKGMAPVPLPLLEGSWTVPGMKGVAPAPRLGGSCTVPGTKGVAL